MNFNLVLVLVQYRFHCLNWSCFVVVLVASVELEAQPPQPQSVTLDGCADVPRCAAQKTARKKCNDFNRLSGSPELILNLPKIKNSKTPEGTALGHTGMDGPQRANSISGCRANVRPEHAQLEEEEGLLVIVPTPKEGKSRNKKEHLQLINGSRGLQSVMLPPMTTLLPLMVTLIPPGKMRVLLVVALMEAKQC